MAAPTPAQVQLIRDYEPALYFYGNPGEPGAERFFPSDAKRYLEEAALRRVKLDSTRADWQIPNVEASKLRAVADEAGVFVGVRDALGVPLYLETPPAEECFLEVSGWKPDYHYADLDRLAARYAEPGPLRGSQLWYHAEFFDAARLRRLFGDVMDPGGSPINFNELIDSGVLRDPALICYYLFYPGHEESLSGCIDLSTGALYEKARDFGSFAGEWSCIALLLDRPDPSAAYAPKWVGLGNRNVGVIQIDGREVRGGMRIHPWSAMQTFEGDHPKFAVARGSHALYLLDETPPPVQPLTSEDPAAAFCGSATPLVDPDPGSVSPDPNLAPAYSLLIDAKIVAGANTGGILGGPLGALIGGTAGLIWGFAEYNNTSHPLLALGGIATIAPAVDAISPSGRVIHPKGKRPADVDPSRAVEWQCEDNVLINDRHYHFTVDRETQFLWGADPDGLGYTGRWGPRVEQDGQARRSGMKFPKFWRIFFDELVRNDPPARTIVLTEGTTWTVPADWNNANNSIECIGGGGGGAGGKTGVGGGGGGGGGGGAYSKQTNVQLTPGGSVPIQVGAAGSAGPAGSVGIAGGDTWFNGASLAASSVGAKGGGTPSIAGAGATGGLGGAAAGGVGTIKNSGGNGGSTDSNSTGGSGGGGAAGPQGNGGAGGKTNNGAEQSAGSGGGGSGGGRSGTSGADGVSTTTTIGGAGGNNAASAGGAAAPGESANGNNGTLGGGGSGSSVKATGTGGNGGAGQDWDAAHGAGGGGGGGSQAGNVSGPGGSGGSFGGGGGGAGYTGSAAAGKGADGIIVIRYTP